MNGQLEIVSDLCAALGVEVNAAVTKRVNMRCRAVEETIPRI